MKAAIKVLMIIGVIIGIIWSFFRFLDQFPEGEVGPLFST